MKYLFWNNLFLCVKKPLCHIKQYLILLFFLQVRKPSVYICTKDHPSEQGNIMNIKNMEVFMVFFMIKNLCQMLFC